jgi:hypothetical protein
MNVDRTGNLPISIAMSQPYLGMNETWGAETEMGDMNSPMCQATDVRGRRC